MQLEDYFDFQRPDDIRIAGTRIGIETVLSEYLHRAQTPEEIVRTYPTLTLEQVYATILYYLHNKEQVTAYLEDWIEYGRRMREEQARNPPPGIARLMKLIADLKAEGLTVDDYLRDPTVRERFTPERNLSGVGRAA